MSEPTKGTLMHYASHMFIPGPDGSNVATVGEPRRKGRLVGYEPLELSSPDFHEAMANRDRIVVAWNAHDPMVEALELVLAFHSPDTQAFVERYGTGLGTREMCDRIRAALRVAKGPADAYSIG